MMILHISRMRRNVDRNVYKRRKNVSATADIIDVTFRCVFVGILRVVSVKDYHVLHNAMWFDCVVFMKCIFFV